MVKNKNPVSGDASKNARENDRRKPLQKRAKATVQKILSATGKLIKTEGYQGLTTNKIAEHADISIGSLYQYFSRREDIVYQLYEDTLEKVAEKISKRVINIIKEDVHTAVPILMTELLKAYEANQLILIQLLDEVPELRTRVKNFSLERLTSEVNFSYFSSHQPDSDPQEIKKNLFFVSTIITENLRKYLSEKPKYIPKQEFITKLSKLVIYSLEHL